MLGNFCQATRRHIRKKQILYSHSSENVLSQTTKHNSVMPGVINRAIKSNPQSRLAKKMDVFCVAPKISQKLRAV